MPSTINAPKTGLRGGRIVSPSAHQPPPELLREVQRENVVRASGIENPITTWNESNLELEALKATVDSFSDVILKPKTVKEGETILFKKLVNVHFKGRESIAIPNGLRSDCVAVACVEPFYRLAGYATETRETFISEFLPLIELLDGYEAENGQSLAPLLELCEQDRGKTREVRVDPPKPPTIQDLISGLTDALKANQKSATA
jgi:hypothetical protein